MMITAPALTSVLVLLAAQPERISLRTLVSLSLSTPEQVFYQRGPVALDVNVHNLTDKTLPVSLVLVPAECKFVQVLYRRLPAEFQRSLYTHPPGWPATLHSQFSHLIIAPRKTKKVTLSLAVDPGRKTFMFDEPGDYEIKLLSNVSPTIFEHDWLATPPLRIHVEPAPPEEAAALADWDVDLAALTQNDGGDYSPDVQDHTTRAFKFMDAHPNSLYTALLRQPTYNAVRSLRATKGTTFTEYEREAFERLKQRLYPGMR